MVTIYKYPLDIRDEQTIVMPELVEDGVVVALKHQILSVEVQRGQPCLWAMVDTERPSSSRSILIKGTGHDCGNVIRKDYLGSFQLELVNGVFVGHVFGF
jgi:hypothetical protein